MASFDLHDRWTTFLRHRWCELATLSRPDRLRRLEVELKDGLSQLPPPERTTVLRELETAFPAGASEVPSQPEVMPPVQGLGDVSVDELVQELQTRLRRLSAGQRQEMLGRLLPESPPLPRQRSLDRGTLLAALKEISERGRTDFDPLCNDSAEVSRGSPTTEQHVAGDFAKALTKVPERGGRSDAPGGQQAGEKNEAQGLGVSVSAEQLGRLVASLFVEAGCLTRLAERGLDQVVEHAFKPVNGLINRAGAPSLEGGVADWWAAGGQGDLMPGLRAGTGLVKCLLHWYGVPWDHLARVIERLDPRRIEDHAPDRMKAGMFGRATLNHKALWETFSARYWATVSELADRPVDRETPDPLVEIKEAFGQKIAAELAESYGWLLTTKGR